MKRRTLASIVVLLALALATAWFVSRGEHTPGSAPGVRTPTNLGAPITKTREDDATLATADAPTDAARTSVTIADPDQIVPVDALWVEGRVEFPPGTPPDERAFVVARGKKYAQSAELRFPVAADGHFRAAFAAGTRKCTLDVEGRFVFLGELAQIDPRHSEQTVVLRAEHGGLLRLRVVPSALMLARGTDLAAARASAHASWFGSEGVDRSRSSSADAAGVVELGGLSTRGPWMVRVALEGALTPAVELITPKPGQVLEHDVALSLAPRFAGVVRGPRGEPIPKASMRIKSAGRGDSSVGATDELGRFEVYADGLGTVWLTAARTGLVAAQVGPFDVVEGFELTQLDLRLGEGMAIEGIVRWPNGAPANGATIGLREPRRGSAAASSETFLTANRDGSFCFTGLEPRAYSVRARLRPEEGPAPGSSSAWWMALREDVPAGARELVLVLGPGATLRGRVVDDLGSPAAADSVRAEPTGDAVAGRTIVATRPSAESGEFGLEGVPDGEWSLVASDGEGNESEPALVVLPRDAARVVQLVLPRLAFIEGRVLDVDGTPAFGAIVSARPTGESYSANQRPLKTGADGKFRFEKLRRFAVTLMAAADDRAPSKELALELVPGQALEDVELVLRIGGTVEGRVLDAEDRPRPDVTVTLFHAAGVPRKRTVQTGPDGTFRIEHFVPGTVTVSADLPASSTRLFNLNSTVELEDAQVVRVQLGGRPTGPILVRGTVRSDGPLAGVEVLYFTIDETLKSADRTRAGTTDADGRYEVRLSAPGPYFVRARVADLGFVQRQVEITDAADQVVDLEFGTGRISGRVVGPDGKPVAGVAVHLWYSDPARQMPAGTASAQTKADGLFAMRGLMPGKYSLGASPGRTGDFAYASIGLVLAAGEHLENVEVRLPRGCSVAVRVVGSDGRPAIGARVGWSIAGAVRNWESTDTAGFARLEGLPASEVSITARSSSEVERAPVRVVPRVDGTLEVTLDLVPGGAFTLRLERRDGMTILEPWSNEVKATDAAGLVWYPNWDDARGTGVLKFRPLLPGVYRVSARFGPKQVDAQVSVDSSTQREVILREPD